MKGVSNNNAHNNNELKGSKQKLKKPIQVLSISKGDFPKSWGIQNEGFLQDALQDSL